MLMLRRTHALLPLGVALTGALLPAQTVSFSVSALTPLQCAVTVGATPTVTSLPAGPLANAGSLGAQAGTPVPVGAATLAWSTGTSATEAAFTLSLNTLLQGANTAHIGPCELLVTYSGVSPTAMPVRYEASSTLFGGLGNATLVSVDVGNNGSIDWIYNSGLPLAGTVPDLVTQPLQLRVLVNDLRFQLGQQFLQLSLRVVPDLGIYVLPIATDCGILNDYTVAPLFDPSIADVQIRSQYVAWHVLGLASQPALLPPSLTLTSVPCFVVPTPDLVLRTGTIWLPIPAAVRPIVIYTQLLDFAGGLRVSDAFHIIAL